MGFQVSPGVNVSEIDLTTIVPAVATTAAGMAGVFQWGPAEEITLVDSVNTLKRKFGGPDDDNYEYFFTAANFLGYGNNLQIVRVVGNGAVNASDGTAALIKNRTDFDNNDGSNTNNFYAKYPGVLGNALAVYAFDGSTAADGQIGVTIGSSAKVGAAIDAGATNITVALDNSAINLAAGDILRLPSGQSVTVKTAVVGSNSVTVVPAISSAQGSSGDVKGVSLESRYRALFGDFDSTTDDVSSVDGSNDLIHVAVVDQTGAWTGTKGNVLETFESLSKATDAKKASGLNNYYRNVINENSDYIWAGNSTSLGFTPSTKADTTFGNITNSDNLTSAPAFGVTLAGGTAAASLAATNLYATGYSKFDDDAEVDVSLILGGPANATISGLIVDICDKRKDCIAFLSPTPVSSFINKDAGTVTNNVLEYRKTSLNKNSSYAVLDSGYKYMYDNFNGVYHYVPLNGDIAGLLARTEVENEAWFSPAGFNRGQIRGVVKLGFNPRQAHRDQLYKNSVNPVVSFPGEGTILFGDKTMQSKPSAFDRINVRRLFIILEKAIATAAKFQLFEFNDEFTRSQFRNLIIPFLRDVQSRRGVQDFKVVCDESNNTGSVIDRNEFVADIYIKPNRSINFIQLNFIATGSGVSFEEVGG